MLQQQFNFFFSSCFFGRTALKWTRKLPWVRARLLTLENNKMKRGSDSKALPAVETAAQPCPLALIPSTAPLCVRRVWYMATESLELHDGRRETGNGEEQRCDFYTQSSVRKDGEEERGAPLRKVSGSPSSPTSPFPLLPLCLSTRCSHLLSPAATQAPRGWGKGETDGFTQNKFGS